MKSNEIEYQIVCLLYHHHQITINCFLQLHRKIVFLFFTSKCYKLPEFSNKNSNKQRSNLFTSEKSCIIVCYLSNENELGVYFFCQIKYEKRWSVSKFIVEKMCLQKAPSLHIINK